MSKIRIMQAMSRIKRHLAVKRSSLKRTRELLELYDRLESKYYSNDKQSNVIYVLF